MCRYFITSCLYDLSLYHIIVLCLRARESLGTSPTLALSEGEGKMAMSMPNAFALHIVASGA